MTEITWDEAYSVGNTALDTQHKILIGLINRLDRIEQDGDDLREVLDKLEDYVHEHFSLEEKMMRDAGYADLDPHIAEHRDFEYWLKSARSHIATGGLDTAILAASIRDHLHEWLIKHILVVDMGYKGQLTGA